MASKTPKADDITPDAPRVSAALDEYDLSEAIVERSTWRSDGTLELRVAIPAPLGIVEAEVVEAEVVEADEADVVEVVEPEIVEPAAE